MRFAPLALALVALPATAGQVHIVGPGHYATIQDAVTAASDGDVVLVKTGFFPSTLVAGKSVAIVADLNATVTVNGALLVRDTNPSQPVVIAGVNGQGMLDVALPERMSGFHASNCAGSVLVQEAELVGWTSIQLPCVPYLPRGGAEVVDCSAVIFSRCNFVGTAANWITTTLVPDGPGLSITGNSRVSLGRCESRGGYAGALCTGYEDAVSGGHGVSMQDSSVLFATASSLLGSNGGSQLQPHLMLPQLVGDGGNDVHHDGPGGAAVWLVGCLTPISQGGYCTWPSLGCQTGAPGAVTGGNVALVIDSATFVPRLLGPNVTRDNQTPEFRVFAPVGTRIEIAVSSQAVFVPRPREHGMLHVAQQHWSSMGQVPIGSDHAGRFFAMPALSPADPARVVYLQARAITPTGDVILSNPRALVIVDSAY